jgi:hypothetical protein
MFQCLSITLLVITVSSGAIAQRLSDRSLQNLYDGHRWFELRDAIAGKSVPPLYSGAVASAFSQVADAERYLNRAVREASTPEAANEARDVLINLYLRESRISDALRVVDVALTVAPSRTDFRNMRTLFDSFRGFPNQSVSRVRARPFPCTVKEDGVYLRLVVNGKPVEWLFDSGFSMAALTESEARALGVTVFDASGEASDFAAGTTRTRAGIARRLTIGGSELRNVPFLVFSDSQPPWNELPPGKRGAIGLPVALALQGIEWTAAGMCRTGPNLSSRAIDAPEAKLAFDGSTLVARAWLKNNPIDLVFDTGNQSGTQLWKRFANEFPRLMTAGSGSTRRVEQIGGARDQQTVVLPELRLRLGGFEVDLKPANVFTEPVGDDVHHGNLGIDVFRKASAVTLDFRRMAVVIR